MLNKSQIRALVFSVLGKNQIKVSSDWSLNMEEFKDKNTKLELAKALIEKLVGIECVKMGGVDNESVQELNFLRNEVYNFNEEVIEEIVNSYRYAYLSQNLTEE